MARTVKLDMTGVESYSKASEGIHTAKVAEIVEKTSQGGDPMLQFAFEITKGDDKGCKVFESFALTDKALWKLKSFLIAVGIKADGKIKIDLDKLIGKVCDIEVFWDEYNGQTRAKISDYYKAGRGGKPQTSDDEEDEAEDDEEDEEDEAPAKPAKKPAPKKTTKKSKPEPEDDEEDEDDEDDDEDEEPAPKKSSKKAPAPAKKTSKKAPAKSKPTDDEEDEDDDDDDEWDEDDD